MSDLVQAIKGKLPSSCIVETCEANDCRVDLEGAPTPNIIVDFDKPGSPLELHATRCDYLFVADKGWGWVVLLELTKGTRKPPKKVIDQLKAGAGSVAVHIPAGDRVNFIPVFVGKADKYMRKYFKKNRIPFHGKKATAKCIKCGDRLSDVL